MESLYILLPLSVLLVLALIGLFAWALHGGQFDDLEREGWRVLGGSDPVPVAPLSPTTQIDATLPTLDLAQVEPVRPCEESWIRIEPRSSP